MPTPRATLHTTVACTTIDDGTLLGAWDPDGRCTWTYETLEPDPDLARAAAERACADHRDWLGHTAFGEIVQAPVE